MSESEEGRGRPGTNQADGGFLQIAGGLDLSLQCRRRCDQPLASNHFGTQSPLSTRQMSG
ncbi:hypothetical protein D9M68_203430 [compost metagenome]